MPRVGVCLSGCGFRDGAEIHESVLTLLCLDQAGAEVLCMAPDVSQAIVVNHLTGETTHESRNVLAESARIALESAATGHLTLSSLHVGSSVLSLERLAALGVPRERSVPAVSLVVTQRLLPALCEACKRRDDLECAIDRYYPLVLEIIETVRAKAA